MKRRADWLEPVAINEHPSMQPTDPKHRIGGRRRGEVRINPATEQEISKAECIEHGSSRCPLHMPVTYSRDHAQHRADR